MLYFTYMVKYGGAVMDERRLDHLEEARRILLEAMDKEDAAEGFYEWCAKVARDADCRGLLLELAKMEGEHKELLADRLGHVMDDIGELRGDKKRAA